jgi:anthranilate/para-aminobenzoate synthase component I
MRAEDKQSAHFLLQMTKENAFEVALSWDLAINTTRRISKVDKVICYTNTKILIFRRIINIRIEL